ncbi:hypothetical protein CYD30_05120 [Kosakonia cowanii]|nr:hypothetical protein EH164_18735 [Kosakonia sp. CCTCC M2018092]QAR47608.1 hypothetical protein EQG67_18500 [Kosakonia cowanii]TNL12672.1 hypothetical protein CYD30_05120 [Kosakonia cowanii]TPD62292.1 hypothetical protein FJP70_17660 [Kosakonia cowanii]TPD86212.1 hypothetical protein FJP67_17665 [Kosakonia cowanii]
MPNNQPQHGAPKAAAYEKGNDHSNHFPPILHILPKSSCRRLKFALSYPSFYAVHRRRLSFWLERGQD